MKKIYLIIPFILLLLCACTKTKEEEKVTSIKTICSGTKEIKDGTTATTKYEITSVNNTVTYLISTEEITSEDNEYLDSAKKSIEEAYSVYKDIDKYNYIINIDGNKLYSIAEINYKDIDLDKLIEIDDANSNIIINNKVSLKSVIDMYKSLGNTCSEE